jgi:hypothetical protein
VFGTRGRGRLLLASVFATVGAFGAAPAALACGSNGYTYAGLASATMAHGVGARLTAIGIPTVHSNGHVAGWVGVGGPGEGPNGKDEWIQVGFSGFAGSKDSNLYYEVTRAGQTPAYHEVQHGLAPGTSRRVAVLEVANRPNAWRVWVNGRPVSPAIYLPKSHGTWRGIATAESWSDTGAAACNSFGYRFDDIQIAQQAGGEWRSLSHALPIRTGVNHLLRATSDASFEAIAGKLVVPTPILTPKHHHQAPTYIAGPRQLANARRAP